MAQKKASKKTAKPSKPKTTAEAWQSFGDSLAAVLGALSEDQYLVISAKRDPWYVQFAAQGAHGMRAEAVSDSYLPEPAKLTATQIAELKSAGWLPPTGTPGEAVPSKQPDGSPNYFREFPTPVPFEEVASLARHTLADIFRVIHPGALEYQSFDRNERSILLPTLGLAHRPQAPKLAGSKGDGKGEGHDYASVRRLCLRTVRAGMKDDQIEYDEDGDLQVRFGSAVAFVRPIKDPLCVRIYAPVLAGVEADSKLLGKLNEVNGTTFFARFLHRDNAVFASVEIPAAPLLPEHLDRAIIGLGRIADAFDDELQEEFGGRTALGEFRPKPADRRVGFQAP